jgi:hypothetical protein
MSMLMFAQMGSKVVSALGQYSAQQHQYRMEKIARQYRERMSAISLSMQNNTLTSNEIEANDALIRARQSIDIAGMKQEAAAEAGAAAAGVAGGSVTSTMRGLMRSRYRAYHAHDQRRAQQNRQNTQARRQTALAAAMNKDITPIIKPSAASALLGLGAGLIDIYDSHQTPGNRTTDALARMGRR